MKKCPRCKKSKDMKYPALSRRDNKTEICSDCGTSEAMFDFLIAQQKNSESSWLKGAVNA